tara:strand:+ start:18 stop:740 length:723 start_codon:yes stop_codon:yes gene_type:complete
MSGAQEYYDSLMAQGYTPEQAKGFTQQHFPGFSPAVAMPAPMPVPMPAAPQMGMPMGAPMGGMMPAPGDRPGVLNWVALGLTAAAITLVFIAMFSNSWMTGEDDGYSMYFGLSEYEADFDGDTEESVTYDDCNADECPDMDDAGLTGMVFMWIAIAAAIGSLVLMCLNNFNVYNSKLGMIACFVSGGLAITGAIIWLLMFPEVEELDDLNLGAGMAFYIAIIAGVCSIGSGVCEIISDPN